jgi:hypothetical protein
MKTCSIEGCDGIGSKLGNTLCTKHYQRQRKHGNPHTRLIPERFEDRFWSKVEKSESCWNWTGAKVNGYGVVKRHTVQGQAHRFSYEMAKGPIPEGLFIDHICRNPSCVNPDHLRPVTQKQNRENLSQSGRGVSGTRGVTWLPESSKWFARVKHGYRDYYVGRFDDLEEARAAVIAKRNELYTHNDADRTVTK